LDWTAAVSQIAFRDVEAARSNLARVAGRVPPAVREALPTLLADSPDPDAALNLFERLSSEENQEVLRLFERNRVLVHYAILVFGYSQYLGETLIQNPDLFHILGRDKSLDRSHSREDFRESFARFRSRSFETDISQLLARFKRREYVRIMLRDVLRIATLADTTAEISALSDVLIEEALQHADAALRNRFGPPQHMDAQERVVETPFAVLALGKLGGSELNYSSDVDLLFLYGDGERPPRQGFSGLPGDADVESSSEISNREYFIRLAQQVTEVLSRMSREGPVFRIDLRLRPQGREGEPAVGLAHALRYYAESAHDWELQALIKVRHCAGDVELGRHFIRAVQPFVYRKTMNFAAIETAVNARERMDIRRQRSTTRRPSTIDVKLDRGGIRDIEFLVQCLQRVYGGSEPWLRSGGTLFSLQKLHDKSHISSKDFQDLTQGYEFLRAVEHRLQIRRGQQVHRLPESEADLRWLHRSVFEEQGPAGDEVDDLVHSVRRKMLAVAEIYQRVIHSQQYFKREKDESEFALAPVETSREQSYNQMLARLASDCPELHAVAARRDLTTHTRRNLHRFLNAAFTSSERYAAVLRAPEALNLALRLFGVSDYLTDILVRHPQEISTVEEIGEPGSRAENGQLFGDTAGYAIATDPVFAYVAASGASRGEKLALLRQHYRHRVFAGGARDVMELRPVYESLAEMSATADDAVRAALAISDPPAGFSVLALGRLGTSEFDVASDADLLFVRDESVDMRTATHVAERMVEALAAYTIDGTVFAVDPRLRPRGTEGELVITPSVLAAYFAEEARPWEALTYTKLRHIAGDEQVASRTLAAVEEHLARFAADPHAFAHAAREMRAKLEKSAEPDFKREEGGFYDIDFIVSYLAVVHGLEGIEGNIRERLHGLAARELLSDDDCATLDAAAELLRTLEHVIRLVLGKARKSLPAGEHAHQTAEQLTCRILGRRFAKGLESELKQTAHAVREVYLRLVV
jgi:glutamate-ammonia-ligase adenylyltransferase